MELSGYLGSEWIRRSFDNIEYILKQALFDLTPGTVDSSSRTTDQNNRINKHFSHKVSITEEILFLGLYNPECVIQNGSDDSLIGQDCRELKKRILPAGKRRTA